METKNKDSKDDASSLPYNLTLMLLMLKRHGVNDSMLCRKYGLNKVYLSKIKRGECLTYAHEVYFTALLKELVSLSAQYKMIMDSDRYREMESFMLEVLLTERGIFRPSASETTFSSNN